MNIKTPMETPMEEQSISPLKMRVLLYIIKKHKWKIVTISLSTAITVLIGSLMATPIYRASAKLLVKPGREDMYISPIGDTRPIIDYSSRESKIQAEIAIIKSSNLSKELIDRIGIDWLFDYPDRSIKGKFFNNKNEPEMPTKESAYKAVLRRIDASGVPNSSVIEVNFSWPDPVIAARVVNELVDLYLVKHLQVHTNPQTYDLLKEQAKKWEVELAQFEKQLEEFKRKNSITSLDQQRTMLLSRLSETEALNKRTEGEIQETYQMIASLERQLSKLEQNVKLQETVNKDSSTVAALKARLVELELQGLKEEIERVKKMLAEEENREQRIVVSGKSPIRRDIEGNLLQTKARLAALKAKKRSQKFQVAIYQKELKALDSTEKDLKELERRVERSEANYKLYSNKFEEAKISESMDKQLIANVSVIEPAVPILRPVKPRKILNVMISGFFGLCTGIGIAFLIEFINPVFHTREDVQQYLGLPVIATLPIEQVLQFEKNSQKERHRVLILVTFLILIALLGLGWWYYKVHKNVEHMENQVAKTELPLSSLEKLEKSSMELGRSNQMQFVTQAEISPSRLMHIKRISALPQRACDEKVLNSILPKVKNNPESINAKIEQSQVKLLEYENDFILSSKSTNPMPSTL
jgi:uncharacterized protein involved in exopolysaccharide biosynthesis